MYCGRLKVRGQHQPLDYMRHYCLIYAGIMIYIIVQNSETYLFAYSKVKLVKNSNDTWNYFICHSLRCNIIALQKFMTSTGIHVRNTAINKIIIKASVFVLWSCKREVSRIVTLTSSSCRSNRQADHIVMQTASSCRPHRHPDHIVTLTAW